MADLPQQQQEWVDGFLFVGNHLAVDFLNTKPVLDDHPREFLTNARALERWLIASRTVTSREDRAMIRAWRDSREGSAFVEKLTAFRERLRAEVQRLEHGLPPHDGFLAEVNTLLKKHPQHAGLRRQGSQVVLTMRMEPRTPEDVWAPIAAATAELLSTLDTTRIRACEGKSCVLHFYDTSKSGSRRWCSMNICGNKFKVAAYQMRRRKA
jgi:predicted RNA-binding Zn ribbon-like protein